jgi:biotin operon repressor
MEQNDLFLPEMSKRINSSLCSFEKDDHIYYIHKGNPIYCHRSDDRNGYRFIVGNLICNKLCTITEFHEAVGEARKNIERYAKTFREQGAAYFFSRKETRGQCYKMTEALLCAVQSRLDEGWSGYRISRAYDISEAAIRYHIKNGNLKKKRNRNHIQSAT